MKVVYKYAYFQVENPSELVNAIITDIEKKQQQTTKFLLRMLPIQATCKVVLL